jgi:superfamily II DNA or RNA helicase
MKIKSIKKTKYNGDVFNLRIKTNGETNHNYFANNICVSNCHKTPAASIKKVLEMCWDSDYRFGVSGTMPKKDSADYLTLQTYMGPLVTVVKAKDLQDRGFISKCKIIQMTTLMKQ